jgi:hypothetical protein
MTKVQDAPAITYEIRSNAIALQNIRELLAALDKQLLGVQRPPPQTNLVLVPALCLSYVDDSFAGAATNFQSYFTSDIQRVTFPTNTIPSYFARMGIGNGTNLFTRTPAYGTNPATYGELPAQILPIHLQERFKYLSGLKYTAYTNSYWTNAVQGTGVLFHTRSTSTSHSTNGLGGPGNVPFKEEWIESRLLYYSYTNTFTNGMLTNVTGAISQPPSWNYYEDRFTGEDSLRRLWKHYTSGDDTNWFACDIGPYSLYDMTYSWDEQITAGFARFSRVEACQALSTFVYFLPVTIDFFVHQSNKATMYQVSTNLTPSTNWTWIGAGVISNRTFASWAMTNVCSLIITPAWDTVVTTTVWTNTASAHSQGGGGPPTYEFEEWGGHIEVVGPVGVSTDAPAYFITPALMKWQFTRCTNSIP